MCPYGSQWLCYWVNWHNLSPPNLCINVSPFCHPRAGSLHPECSQLVPPSKKTPKAPKSLWAINSSQGYDSSRLGFSSSENSNPFPLNPGQAICLRLFSSHLQDINPKLADKDSLCIFAVCPLCVGRSVKQDPHWRQKVVFTDSFTSTAPSLSQWPHPQLISQVESCWMFRYNNMKSNWVLPCGTFQIGFSNISL